MAQDDSESRIADVADPLGVDAKSASVYRHRLIRAGMSVSAGRGRIDLAHHAARQRLRTRTPAP